MPKEREAIEIVEGIVKSYIEADECGLSNNDFKHEIRALQTVLNMLKEKDKQIDLMANYIVDLIKYNNPEEKREVEEIKQYFENQNKLFKYDYNKKSTLDINSNAEI